VSGRPTLTPHQADVLVDLRRMSRGGERWVHERYIGSHGALWKLVRKGFAEAREVRGPRGGITYEYKEKI
jgi:hypothetical protein